MTIDLGTKNAKDLADGVWGTWFLYGPAGSGKTTLASSFPRPCFVVPRVEGSIETLRGLDVPYFEIGSDSNADIVNGVGGLDKILHRLELIYKKDPSKFPFDTIVFESISHLSDIIVAELTKNGQQIMDQSKWGILANRLNALHVRAKAMDLHIVYTALEKPAEKGDDGTMSSGGPLLSGQVAQKLPASCTVIGYCELYAEKTHRVHFRKYRNFQARSRFKRLPEMYAGAFPDFYANIAHLLDADAV